MDYRGGLFKKKTNSSVIGVQDKDIMIYVEWD